MRRSKGKTGRLVEVSSFLFIDEYERNVGERVRGVVFNKFMTLLNHDLKTYHGIDIKLPHCWYRWGDEVVKYYFAPFTKWDHEDLTVTTVSWRGDIPDMELGDPTISLVRDYVSKFIVAYSGNEGWEKAIDRLYGLAPYGFQNEYRKLRENLKETKNGYFIQDYYSNVLLPLFYSAMAVFPSEFSKIAKDKERFESVFKESVRENVSIEDIRDLTEEFWFFFCYHLRVDKRCHENISAETLNIWKSSIPWEGELYARSLQDRAFKLKPEKYDKNINELRGEHCKRVDEFERLLDEFREADRKYSQDVKTDGR